MTRRWIGDRAFAILRRLGVFGCRDAWAATGRAVVTLLLGLAFVIQIVWISVHGLGGWWSVVACLIVLLGIGVWYALGPPSEGRPQ